MFVVAVNNMVRHIADDFQHAVFLFASSQMKDPTSDVAIIELDCISFAYAEHTAILSDGVARRNLIPE